MNNSLVNHPRLATADNVVILLVSATPYNVLTTTSRIPVRRAVRDGDDHLRIAANDEMKTVSDREVSNDAHVVDWCEATLFNDVVFAMRCFATSDEARPWYLRA